MTLRRYFAPHLNRHVVMGRKAPRAHCPHMRLKNYFGSVVPTPPSGVNYANKGLTSLRNIFLNDTLGDCVIAMGYHVEGLATGNAGNLFVPSTSELVADYSAIGGYVPGDPNTDQGCDMQTALNYWQQTGFANGTKLAGWMAVDPSNMDEMKVAMWLFENLCFGIGLPDAWVNPFPNADDFVWDDGSPDMYNGHAFMGTGYGDAGILIDTWGLFGTLTWAAINHLCGPSGGGELYVMLTPDILAKGVAKSPLGLDWSTLISDFNALGGSVTPPQPPAPPAPVPPPAPPVPPPAPAGPSLDDAIAWATQGLRDNWPSQG